VLPSLLLLLLCIFLGTNAWHQETQLRLREPSTNVSFREFIVQNTTAPPRRKKVVRTHSLAFVHSPIPCRMRAARALCRIAKGGSSFEDESEITILSKSFRAFVTSRGFGAHTQPCIRDEDCGEGMRCRFSRYGGYCALNVTDTWVFLD